MSTLFNPDKENYEISVWEDLLVPQKYYQKINNIFVEKTKEEYNAAYKDATDDEKVNNFKVVLEHFEEQKIASIGAHDMNSRAAASNPTFVENVNGSYTLTFTMYYKYFDEDILEYVENPFTQLLQNERKVKLYYRNKWYDLLIKNRVEDSSNYTFTFTAKSLYTTELGKNGFKVELDSELENNQGTVTELGKTILKGTDWEIIPVKEELTKEQLEEWKEKYGEDFVFSDIIVQTKIEPLYIGTLNQDIEVQLVNSYLPDRDSDMINGIVEEIEGKKIIPAIKEIIQDEEGNEIKIYNKVLFFYSDINNNESQPQILYRPDGEYKTDINEDIITNSYNYRVVSPEITYTDTEISYNIPSVCYDSQDLVNNPKFVIYDKSRGEKVIRSAKTGYDPDLDQFITYYKKDDDETIYYGYEKIESLSSHLTQNFLANSDDFTSINTGWLFDGTPSVSNLKEDGTIINDSDTTYTGQIYLLNKEGFAYDPNNEGGAESVMVMRLREGKEADYYRDSGGHLYKVEKNITVNNEPTTQTKYIPVDSDEGRSFEVQIKQQYQTLRAQGHEKFIDLTDEELQKIIDSTLLNMRYSNRGRRAINTGLAANRKIIENLSNSEEYVFATSLGKYKETDDAPKYGREIKYGATTPTELFIFTEEGNTDIEASVSEEAYLKTYEEIISNPQKYLETDERGNITDAIYKKAYDDYVTAALAEYESKYIENRWLIGKVVDPNTKDNWERGGREFRASFKKYLAEFFTSSVISILSSYSEITLYNTLYKDLQTPFFNALSKAYDEKQTIKEKTSDFLWISKQNSWVTSGNDENYPEYEDVLNSNYSSINSFCGQLYWDLFVAIRDKYTLAEISEEPTEVDDIKFTVLIPKAEQLQKLIEQTFDNLVDQMGILGSYKAKKEYELPSLFNKNGGVKYQQHKANWEENGREHALQVVLKSEDFISKFSHGTYTPEIDKNNSAYQDFNGEIRFLNDFKVEWEKAVQAFTEICAPSYIGTDKYYEEINNKFQEGWQNQSNKWNPPVDSNIELPIYWRDLTTKKWLSNEEYEDVLKKYQEENENITEEQLQEVINNYVRITDTELKDNVCGWGFCEIYFNLKDSILAIETQTATYTISNEEYSLNETTGNGLNSPSIYIQNSEGKWNPTIFRTLGNGAEYVAYEDPENGYYVFDRQKQKIRLFNPKTDREKSTYLPIKNDSGLYIYDEVRGIYRKFRNWYKTEYRDLKTGEPLEQIKGGYPGDIIYHDVQWFDGHIGSWDEKPQRYDMIRTYEDEEEREYLRENETYIWRKNEAPTFLEKVKEFLTFWDGDLEADNTLIEYEYSYPVGFQLDKFVEDDNGPYIKMDYANELKDDFISIGTINTPQEMSTYTVRATTKTTVIGRVWQWFKEEVIQPVIDFGHQLEEWVEQGIDKITDEVEKSIAQAIQSIYSLAEQYGISTKEIGLLFDNLGIKNENEYKENQYRFFMNLKKLLIPNLNDDELREELITAGRLKAKQISEQKARNSTTENLPTPVENEIKYVKYRWWYWRHWGKQRYRLKEKLCVPTINEDEFKVYNNIEDAVSKNYGVEEGRVPPKGYTAAFYLKDREISYRPLIETDFSPDIFEMLPDEKMDKTHCVYNSYYNYYRPYKDGDAKIDLKDDKFGFWCQTYNPTTREEYEGIIENLQNPCMLVDSIYIPYDKRVYNLGLRRFYRKREFPDNFDTINQKTYYVYHNGNYISLYDYYSNYSKTSELNYEGLKIYFTPEYTYDAANFAIQIDGNKAFNYNEDGTNETPKYLGLTIEAEPDGYFDTSVYNKTTIEEGVKERWCYWKIQVNEGISLIEDQLSSVGLVFESAIGPTEGENSEKIYKDYAFLGMQLFKYFEYESTEIEKYKELIEEDSLSFKYNSNEKTYTIAIIGTKLTELLESVDLNLDVSNETPEDNDLSDMASDNFGYIQEFLETKGYDLDKISVEENENGIIYSCQLKQTKERNPILPIVPGQAPDAKELVITNYYIYDPAQSTSNEDVIYSYRGQNPESKGFTVDYDDLCQKIRSVKGKESNYFKLLQDTCDTFECWMEEVIPHDNMGRVSYIDKSVYEQINIEENEEPQIYIGELPEDTGEKEYQLKGYIRVPDKKIRFKEYVGYPNYTGFKYGVNLKHIKRTLDSETIATRTIVKPNSNEYATDGFCTIQRAEENVLKENFIYDFTYYINKGLLKYSEINPDLYSSNPDKLSYYVKLARLNKENDQIILDLSAVMIELDKANAAYETAVLGRDAAQEEIAKLIEIFKNNYDTYGNLIDTPWSFNKSKEYAQKSQTSSYEYTTSITGPDGTYDVTIPAMTTTVDYPKYNDTLRNYFDQMDTFQRNHEKFKNAAIEAKANKEKYEAERDRLLELEKEIVEKKNELNKLFYHKYSRYIQEGSWIDEKYIDDNLYYLDALAVSRASCVPKITYDISVVDLYGAIEYEQDKEVLNFELGDRTYVEDTEFFGYVKETSRPYQEQIVISEKTYVLENASQNKIQVKNYSTQFDNLFQRIAATSQTLQFNEGSFGRVSSILNNDGSINTDRLQQALDSASLAFTNSVNEDVYWDHTGIWVKSFETDANILRLTSLGIGLSTDGGNTYMTAITGAGINAAAITSGMLNVENLLIGSKSSPNFLWNKFGISSFKTLEDGIDYSTFVRLDQYGVYGIKNWSKNGVTPKQMSINDTFEPLRLSDITENENAVFGLTWDGFFLNTGSGTDRGRVTIGTNQDIRMSVKDDTGWRDRVIIGRMADITTNEQTYGFRLVNENGEIVMDTNLQGELYLKRKLRISNFTNEMRYDQDLKYDENGNIVQGDNPTFTNAEDRVTLGIVNTYDRKLEGYEKVELSGQYSSSQYLTKVFSVKVNDNVGDEQFSLNPLKLGLIEENETFAIFDNGNLYAKNAWIEGHVNANTGTIGNLDIANGGIQTKSFNILNSTNGWRITPTEARFNNVVVSGSIKAATFEYQEIQTIGGTFLIRPTAIVESYEFLTWTEFSNKYINQANNTPALLSEDKFLVLTLNSQMGHTDRNIIKIIPKNKNNSLLETTNQNKYLYSTINSQIVNSKTVIFVQLKESEYQTLDLDFNNSTIIDIGKNTSANKDIGIVFNSSNENIIFPSNGISIFETWSNGTVSEGFSWNIKNRIFLGKIPSENDADSISNHIASIFKDRPNNNYGLYADNVYLNGALEVKGVSSFAGIDTLNTVKLTEVIDKAIGQEWGVISGKVVFYGGTHVPNGTDTKYTYNFAVDEYGNLFANSGYFKGTIISESVIQASELKTAKITGIGTDEYGLSIYGGGNAIRFALAENTDNLFSLDSDKMEIAVLSVFTNSISATSIKWSDKIQIDDQGIKFSGKSDYKYKINSDEDYFYISVKDKENYVSKFKVDENDTIIETDLKLKSEKTQSSIKYEAVSGGYDIYIA